jgi:hypothetical protein
MFSREFIDVQILVWLHVFFGRAVQPSVFRACSLVGAAGEF